MYVSTDPTAGAAIPPQARTPVISNPLSGSPGSPRVPAPPGSMPGTGGPGAPPGAGITNAGPSTTPPAGGGYTGSPTDINAYVNWMASQPGHDPILDTPGGKAYYVNAITNSGGLSASNLAYWQNKMTLAASGGAVGAGGGDGMSGPNSYGGYFQVPTLADAMNMPGMQFAVDEGTQALERSAAAKGDLLTTGTLRDLSNFTVGTALSQGYIPLSQLQLANQEALAQNNYLWGALGKPSVPAAPS